jgi:hypothetical protein
MGGVSGHASALRLLSTACPPLRHPPQAVPNQDFLHCGRAYFPAFEPKEVRDTIAAPFGIFQGYADQPLHEGARNSVGMPAADPDPLIQPLARPGIGRFFPRIIGPARQAASPACLGHIANGQGKIFHLPADSIPIPDRTARISWRIPRPFSRDFSQNSTMH